MYRVSILLFAIAAVAGLIMAITDFRKSALPRPALAALHGLFAASGLIVLSLAVAGFATLLAAEYVLIS